MTNYMNYEKDCNNKSFGDNLLMIIANNNLYTNRKYISHGYMQSI